MLIIIPGEFIYDNLLIQSNIIESARVNMTKNFYLLDLLLSKIASDTLKKISIKW